MLIRDIILEKSLTTADFEKIFFGDLKKAFETDTDVESEVYHSIADYIESNTDSNKDSLQKTLHQLRNVARKYPADLLPNSPVAYRGINATKELYQKVHELFVENPLDDEWIVIDGNFSYTPYKEIQSWTTTREIAAAFAASSDETIDRDLSIHEYDPEDGNDYPIIIKANVDDSFILNAKLTNLIAHDILDKKEYEIIRITRDPIDAKFIMNRQWLIDACEKEMI